MVLVEPSGLAGSGRCGVSNVGDSSSTASSAFFFGVAYPALVDCPSALVEENALLGWLSPFVGEAGVLLLRATFPRGRALSGEGGGLARGWPGSSLLIIGAFCAVRCPNCSSYFSSRSEDSVGCGAGGATLSPSSVPCDSSTVAGDAFALCEHKNHHGGGNGSQGDLREQE